MVVQPALSIEETPEQASGPFKVCAYVHIHIPHSSQLSCLCWPEHLCRLQCVCFMQKYIPTHTHTHTHMHTHYFHTVCHNLDDTLLDQPPLLLNHSSYRWYWASLCVWESQRKNVLTANTPPGRECLQMRGKFGEFSGPALQLFAGLYSLTAKQLCLAD